MVRKHKRTIPVLAKDGRALMPTCAKRARRLIERGEATPFWSHGIFCLRLRRPPTSFNLQPVAVGIDPGSKREAISVVSAKQDFIHIHIHARTGISKKVESRRALRRSRRFRKTPCRQCRFGRATLTKPNRIPPSTKARWHWKLRLTAWLSRLYPVSTIVVEDICAVTKKGQRRWNTSFSPLEVGKAWFYHELKKIAVLHLRGGHQTKEARDRLQLKKSQSKLLPRWDAHAVDSFVLALEGLGIARQPTQTDLWCVAPFELRRRSLHLQTPKKGGRRRRHGGAVTHHYPRGTLVRYRPRQHGGAVTHNRPRSTRVRDRGRLLYLGGWVGDRVSLHELSSTDRVTKSAKWAECRVICHNHWRFWTQPRFTQSGRPMKTIN